MITKLEELLQLAKKKKSKKVAIAVAEDVYVLNAINKAYKLGLIAPIFIGDKFKIEESLKKLHINYESIELIHCNTADEACKCAVQLVSEGNADILMKGAVSTNILLKHVVSKEYGLLRDKLLSHLAIFESSGYHKLIGVTDAAMNISPGIQEKVKIAKNAISAFHSLGISRPKVALLAAVEKINPKMRATHDAAVIKVMGERGQLGNCFVDGPLALDNAISKEAANLKHINSQVAGDADILVTPDIESGNILYKSLSFINNSKCAAIILGSMAPIVLTSRADTEENKFLSLALGVLTSK